jgi:Flp pilus assembly protein TadG
MALMLFVMLGLVALAIDLAALRDARGEAQRAADAIALAGAAGYLVAVPVDQQTDSAQKWAVKYAQLNRIRADSLDTLGIAISNITASWGGAVRVVTSNEVTLNIIPDSQRVRAWVRREGISTFFGGTLGVPWGHVKAMATAMASTAGEGKCLRPLAIPDLWKETNTSSGRTGQDKNANKLWDTGEGWQFEPTGANPDVYLQFDPSAPAAQQPLQTGYGSGWRNGPGQPINDQGRIITIKAQRPGEAITSGFFYPWRIGESSGANDYKNNILGCNPTKVSVGDTVDIENGNMVGPTRQAFGDLISQDPSATYDPATNAIINSTYGNDWRDSPRVVPLALFDPNQIADIQGGGNLNLVFNNFAMFFIEGFDESAPGPPSQAPLKGRFLYFFQGTGPGPVAGPLVRRLSLIQ